MNFSCSNKAPFSRLMLGTVQFGMPYGVANRTGQPSYRDVVQMVALAIEGGVNCFDTAAAYGESEAVLGRAIHELGVADQVSIVTKVLPVDANSGGRSAEIDRSIRRSIDESRSRLQVDTLDLVLFHRESDAAFFDVLEELRTDGKLHGYGVSCDNRPGPSLQFAADSRVSGLQIPGNIVDRRHQQSGILQIAGERKIGIFVRSVYLQGLLLMPDDAIPSGLRDIIPIRQRLTDLATQGGGNFGELCVRYMLSQEGVTSVIAGVETIEQVRDNLALFERGSLPDDLRKAVDAIRPELPEDVVTPSRWPQLNSGR